MGRRYKWERDSAVSKGLLFQIKPAGQKSPWSWIHFYFLYPISYVGMDGHWKVRVGLSGLTRPVSLRLWSPNQSTERQFMALLKRNKTLSLKWHTFHGLCAPAVNVPAQQELVGLPPTLCPQWALMDGGHWRVVHSKSNEATHLQELKC